MSSGKGSAFSGSLFGLDINHRNYTGLHSLHVQTGSEMLPVNPRDISQAQEERKTYIPKSKCLIPLPINSETVNIFSL